MPSTRLSLLALFLLHAGCGGAHGPVAKGEVQYLDFVVPVAGLFESTGPGAGDPAQIHAVIDADVASLIATLGTAGNGKSRRLGFHYSIPIWAVEGQFPGKTVNVIEQSFKVARERGVAVHFSIETHYFWNTRPDLFNYFEPSAPGYDPNNRSNVEWSDWSQTANRHRYVNHGVPVELAPHMCYLSNKIQSEVTRLGGLVGGALKKELDTLAAAGQADLFSGLTVTSEPSLDNYTNIDTIDPAMAELMTSAGAPKVRLGYCSFTAAGFSQASPPADLAAAAATVNRQWVQSWAYAIAVSGVPTERLYSHIAAGGGTPTDAPFEFLNAPIDTAFVESSRPGWTSYPQGSLTANFDVLYQSLAAHGNPPWGGTEAAPFDGRAATPVAEYLSRHFDHGATVVVLNDGATGDLASALHLAVYGVAAIDAYQYFLNGE